METSNYDCGKLVELIVQYLPGFRDEAIYEGRQVFFYKRAQILTADLIGAYTDIGMGDKWTNKECLTMFADYRVPQILRHLGIFVYSEDLAQKIDGLHVLPYSSEEEVEIRAATVVAVEKII